MEPFLQPSPGAGDEQYRDNAAAPGNERFAPQRNCGELRVADQRRSNRAERWRAARFSGSIPAYQKIQPVKSSVSRNV